MAKEYLDKAGLNYFWSKVKAYVSAHVGGAYYGECSVSASTVAKTVTVDSSFVLQTGAKVTVKFTNANTASAPTLNVNGTGAKTMKRYGTANIGTQTATSWYAGAVLTFAYDGTYWFAENHTYTPYPTDYITQQGTSGIWTYRKYNSGVKECWGTYTASIAITTSGTAYGGYRSGALSIPTLPVTYTSAPTITATAGSTQGYWVNNVVSSTTGGTFYLSCGSSLSAASRSVHFHVIGK